MSNISGNTNIFQVDVILKNILRFLNADEVIKLYKSNVTNLFYIGEDYIQYESKRHILKSKQLLRELNIPLKYKKAFYWNPIHMHHSRILQKFKNENNKMIIDCQNIEKFFMSKDNMFSNQIIKHCKIELYRSRDPFTQIYNVLYFDFKTLCSFTNLKRFFGNSVTNNMDLSPCIKIYFRLIDNEIEWEGFSKILGFLEKDFKSITQLCWTDKTKEISLIEVENRPDTFFDSLYNMTLDEGILSEAHNDWEKCTDKFKCYMYEIIDN